MNIVVLLFLQCGTNHRDCFQSAYCEASIGHSAGYESEALFYHSAKIRASASDWMLLCIIIQQRTARTSVYIMILTYLLTYPLCAKDDTRSRATKDVTYDGRWQQPMPISNIAVPLQIFFLFFTARLQVLFGRHCLFSRSTWAQIRTVLIFYLLFLWRQGLFISNASLCSW